MRLTKVVVDKFPIPPIVHQGVTAQKRYYDEVLKGFGVRVTSGGTKAFFVEKLIKNRLRRITLGKYPDLTVEQARKEAHKMLGQIATGIDPMAEKRAAKIREVTLSEAFEKYLQTRKTLKPKTLYDYRRVLKIAFSSLSDKPLLSITKDKVASLHTWLGQEHGKAYANLAMRILRAIFNFAAGQYEDSKGHSLIAENPVKRLSQTRAWYRVTRRESFIKSHEIQAWYKGVQSLGNEILRDYLILILFTGLRRQEAAKLRWNQIDFKARTLTITETKNNSSHTLPLPHFLQDLLAQRKLNTNSIYVFPGTGAGGHIVEPKRQIAKIITSTGVLFCVHDLRRTFITIAESLDIPAYALKRLLNHKMGSDVTAGYIVMDVERLRKPIQLIADYILKCMGIEKSAEVIELAKA